MEPDQLPNGMYQATTPEYFDLVHIPLRGRPLAAAKPTAPTHPRWRVISQRMAERWWKNESPIGKHIRLGGRIPRAPG